MLPKASALPFKLSHFANRTHQHLQYLKNLSDQLGSSASSSASSAGSSGGSAAGGGYGYGGAKWSGASRAKSRALAQQNIGSTTAEGTGARIDEDEERHIRKKNPAPFTSPAPISSSSIRRTSLTNPTLPSASLPKAQPSPSTAPTSISQSASSSTKPTLVSLELRLKAKQAFLATSAAREREQLASATVTPTLSVASLRDEDFRLWSREVEEEEKARELEEVETESLPSLETQEELLSSLETESMKESSVAEELEALSSPSYPSTIEHVPVVSIERSRSRLRGPKARRLRSSSSAGARTSILPCLPPKPSSPLPWLTLASSSIAASSARLYHNAASNEPYPTEQHVLASLSCSPSSHVFSHPMSSSAASSAWTAPWSSSASNSPLSQSSSPSRMAKRIEAEFPPLSTEQRAIYDALTSQAEKKDSDGVLQTVNNYQAVGMSLFHPVLHSRAISALLETRKSGQSFVAALDMFSQMQEENLVPSVDVVSDIIVGLTELAKETEYRKSVLTGRKDRREKSLQSAKQLKEGMGLGVDSESMEALEDGEEEQMTLSTWEEMSDLEKLNSMREHDAAIEIFRALGRGQDWLSVKAFHGLLYSATQHKQFDVGVEVLRAFEQSPFRKLNSESYALILYFLSRHREWTSAKMVMDRYLRARQMGTVEVVEKKKVDIETPGEAYKNRFLSDPLALGEIEPFDMEMFKGDEGVWYQFAEVLHTKGAPSSGSEVVDLIHRMTSEKGPGFPEKVPSELIAVAIKAFLNAGDPESAKTWFDKTMEIAATQATGEGRRDLDITTPRLRFYRILARYFIGRRHAASRIPYLDLVQNMILNSERDNYRLSITIWTELLRFCFDDASKRPKLSPETQEMLDRLVNIRSLFQEAIQKGLVHGLPTDFAFGRGQNLKLLYLLTANRRWEEALDVLRETASTLTKPGVEMQMRKSLQTLVVPAAVGLDYLGTGAYPNDPEDRPPLPHVLKALEINWRVPAQPTPLLAALAVDCYLDAKHTLALQGKDVAALNLSTNEWLIILHAFVFVEASKVRGLDVVPRYQMVSEAWNDAARHGVHYPIENTLDIKEYWLSMAKAFCIAHSPREIIGISSVVPSLHEKLMPALAQLVGGREVEQSIATVRATASGPPPSEEQSQWASAFVPTNTDFPPPPTTFPEYQPAHPSSIPEYQQQSGSPEFHQSEAPYSFAPQSTWQSPVRHVPGFALDMILTQKVNGSLHKDPVSAFRMVDEGLAKKQFVDPITLIHLIEQLGRKGDLVKANELYLPVLASLQAIQDPRKHFEIITKLESAMIIALAYSGHIAKAGDNVQKLDDMGSAATADAYAALILNSTPTTDQTTIAVTLFEHAMSRNVAPTTFLYNCVLKHLAHARKATEALNYFEDMKNRGVHPNERTYGSLIHACLRQGDESTAIYLFEEMIKLPNYKANVPPYNTFMQYYAETKPNRGLCLRYYELLQQAGLQPTDHTYNMLMKAYGCIEPPMPEKMMETFHLSCADRKFPPNGAMWATILTMEGCVLKDPKKAIETFESIPSHPSTQRSKSRLPDAVVYEALFNVLSANKLFDKVEHYIERMQKETHMTAYVANSLIKLYASQNKMSDARKLFESLQDPPSGHAAKNNHPVDRSTRGARTNQSSPPVRPGAPVHREASTYEVMVRAELGAGERARAQEIYERAKKRCFPAAVDRRIENLLLAQ